MKKVLLILCLFSFLSCGDDDLPGPTSPSKYFIQVYQYSEHLYAETYEGQMSDYVVVRFSGEPIRDEDLCLELSEKYGDNNYNKQLLPYSNVVLAEEVTSVTVTTLSYFDDEHPAGSLVNDIMRLCYFTPYEFIRNGYQYPDWSVNLPRPSEFGLNWWRTGYLFMTALVSELQAGDLILLRPECYLFFEQEPEAKGEYEFEVMFRVGETELKSKIIYIFR